MAQDDRFTTRSPAVEQAAEILRYLASDSKIRANLTHISQTVRINKSKTHVLLNALEKCGFVTKDPIDKSYSLGFGLIPIGLMALENTNYEEAAGPILEELARDTKSTALFGLIVNERLVIAKMGTSGQAVESRMKPGHTFPVYYGAHGKVIIASLPEEEQRQIFANKKVAFEGDSSKLKYSDVKEELDLCKKRGFAHRSLAGPGDMIHLVASAVLGANGRPIGVFMIVGLFKKSVVNRYGTKVAMAAKKLSVLLGGIR